MIVVLIQLSKFKTNKCVHVTSSCCVYFCVCICERHIAAALSGSFADITTNQNTSTLFAQT